MAAFVAAAYMKSVPMIYSGQEVGYSQRLTFPFTGTVINWNGNKAMTAEYKKLLTLYNSSTAIRRGTITTYSDASVCAFTRNHDAETIFVASNLKNTEVSFSLPAEMANTSWKNAFTNETVSLTNRLELLPWQYVVLKK